MQEGGAGQTDHPIEVEFVRFVRILNLVVEPIVRRGFASPRLSPCGFIVVETVGRKSGMMRRCPLLATRIGRHMIVATFRGNRSQWVRNLAVQPRARYWTRGAPHDARAFVIRDGARKRIPTTLPGPLRSVATLLQRYAGAGWAFAILSPRSTRSPRARR